MNPENEDGNIEYKFKLLDINDKKIEDLASQMRFRIKEGNGECIYNIGVKDDGSLPGITEEEYKETIRNINLVAEKNNYSTSLLSSSGTKNNKKIYEILVREINKNKFIDIKIAVAGHIDAGKTTIVGSLITGQNDNGRGLSRSFVFKHKHELETGRTSCVAHEILGFDYEGKIVNYQGINKLSWPEIVQKSAKIISFTDLAGHEKYLKTTILGLASSFPDICMIMVDANNGIKPMTKEHIFLCVTLKIPFIIVISKIDICKTRKNILEETIQGVKTFLKYPGIRRFSVSVKTKDDIILCAKNIHSESITPIFYTSCVSGEGIDMLKMFFNIVGKKMKTFEEDQGIVEFHIDHLFNVYGFGIVLGGNLINGTINVGDKLLVGPQTGSFEPIIIRSIYCKKIPLQQVSCGSYVCLGIKKIDKLNIKRGNVIISNKSEKLIVRKFTATINVLRTHSTTVKVGYEPMFHSYSIRQVVKILDITNKKNARGDNIVNDNNILRNGDIATVELEFKYHPEYLKVGSRFILSEGKCKIVGEILTNDLFL
jgi:GTPase